MNNMCRLCLRRAPGSIPLFNAKVGENSLTEMIRTAFRIEFDQHGDFPKNVCEYCLRKTDYLYSFYQELTRTQAMLGRLKEAGSGLAMRQLIAAEGPGHYSDGIFGEVEELEEVITDETEGAAVLEEEVVDEVEIEAVGFDEEISFGEQLVDMKIEALEDGPEFLVEKLSEVGSDPEDEEEFKGFAKEDIVPVKLTALSRLSKGRRAKNSVPKLEVVETIPNKCYVCSEVFDGKDQFDLHLITHRNMLPYHCADCSTEASPVDIKTMVLLNKHFETHGFNYVCDFCPLRFRSYPPLYDHTRNFHTDKKEGFNCDVCGQMFNEIRKFQKHVRAHRNQQTERYKCKTCDKTFQTGTILRRHERIHKSESTFQCPFCQRGFNHESNYQQHKMRHIQQQHDAQNGFPCSICETHFTNPTDLRTHMHQHFPEDPLYAVKPDFLPENLKDSSTYPRPCEEPNCKYVAPSYQLMWSHYRNHYKQYDCSECDRKFATATILKNHIAVIHRRIRKYHCDRCGKTFAYQHKYKEHMNMHQGIKSRNCRYCSKTFTHSSNLMVHERIHTKSRPYSCDICGSTHVTTTALKKHKKTHRNNKGDGGGVAAGQEVAGNDEEYMLMMDDSEIVGEEEVVEEVTVKEQNESFDDET